MLCKEMEVRIPLTFILTCVHQLHDDAGCTPYRRWMDATTKPWVDSGTCSPSMPSSASACLWRCNGWFMWWKTV